ncbi:hypothetical protein BDZ94DRAFT_799551 [Collybia nuda]|uniref:Uncharacterized protein n=1 Tax=Collybia nuda TaxID=64659 RepID=A0A9P5Y502_9AGAR|nr:hypothetical protein BDZ94DRAFT_799551 [Collybia nuda]
MPVCCVLNTGDAPWMHPPNFNMEKKLSSGDIFSPHPYFQVLAISGGASGEPVERHDGSLHDFL